MSLTDKVIKNTYYTFLSQILSLVFPLFLTPIIISRIGNTEYGIYAFIIGATGILGLFDLSVAGSFIKFISEHYNRKEYDELNHVINTSVIFYFIFSVVCFIIALLLKNVFLSAINIPAGFENKAMFTYIVSLTVFSAVNILGVFTSILASLQKMYLTSLYSIIFAVVYFIGVIIALFLGFGLYGILIVFLFQVLSNLTVTFLLSRKNLPEMKLGLGYFRFSTLRKMMNFGIQLRSLVLLFLLPINTTNSCSHISQLSEM